MSVLVFCEGTLPLHAQTWRTINSGQWSDPANWGGVLPANDGTADLVFSAVGDPIKSRGTTTLDRSWDVRSILWNPISLDAGVSMIRGAFGGSSGPPLTLRNGLTNASGGRVEIYPTISLSQMQEWNDATGNTTVFGGIIGAGGIRKTGSGLLKLEGLGSSYTGGTIIEEGVLQVGSPGPLGAASGTIGMKGGTFRMAGYGQMTLPQSLQLTTGLSLIEARPMTLTLSGAIDGPGTLRLAFDSSYGLGAGASRFVLTNTNSYSGGTEVDRATLRIVGSQQSLGSGPVTLKDGAVLRLTSGSNLAPGQTVTMKTGSAFVLTDPAMNPEALIDKDPARTTGGTLALTSATAGMSLDMSAIGNGEFFVGSSEDIVYTGTITPGTGGIYRVGGGSGDVGSFSTITFGGTPNVFTGARALLVGGNGELNPLTDSRDNSTVRLTGANDYSGGTMLNGGVLVIGDDAALGSGLLTFNRGMLSTSGGPRTLANPILFAEPTFATNPGELIPTDDLFFRGPVDLGGRARRFSGSSSLITFGNTISNGGLTLSAGRWAMLAANTFAGELALESGASLDIAFDINSGDNGATLALRESVLHPTASIAIHRPVIVEGRNSVTVDPGETTTLDQTISGSGTMVKAGDGTLAFRGNLLGIAHLDIDAGTARLEGVTASPAGFMDTFVRPGARLTGTGHTRYVIVEAGGRLAPGLETPGELGIQGLALYPGALLDFDLGAASDFIRIEHGFVFLPDSGSVIVNISDAGGLATDVTYSLIDFRDSTGLVDVDPARFQLGSSPIAGGFSVVENTLVFRTVPEPAAGMVILVGVFFAASARRSRKPSGPMPARREAI